MLKTPMGINERMTSLRIPLVKGLCVYALKLVSEKAVKDSFYDTLHKTIQLMILGDLDVRCYGLAAQTTATFYFVV